MQPAVRRQPAASSKRGQLAGDLRTAPTLQPQVVRPPLSLASMQNCTARERVLQFARRCCLKLALASCGVRHVLQCAHSTMSEQCSHTVARLVGLTLQHIAAPPRRVAELAACRAAGRTGQALPALWSPGSNAMQTSQLVSQSSMQLQDTTSKHANNRAQGQPIHVERVSVASCMLHVPCSTLCVVL
jgi:hypothetical protein